MEDLMMNEGIPLLYQALELRQQHDATSAIKAIGNPTKEQEHRHHVHYTERVGTALDRLIGHFNRYNPSVYSDKKEFVRAATERTRDTYVQQKAASEKAAADRTARETARAIEERRAENEQSIDRAKAMLKSSEYIKKLLIANNLHSAGKGLVKKLTLSDLLDKYPTLEINHTIVSTQPPAELKEAVAILQDKFVNDLLKGGSRRRRSTKSRKRSTKSRKRVKN